MLSGQAADNEMGAEGNGGPDGGVRMVKSCSNRLRQARARCLVLAPVALLGLLSLNRALAAGPMGHYLIAQNAMDQIRAGRAPAPAELQHLLTEAECRRAFCGGAVGPDLDEGRTHYNNTADTARRLMEAARDDMRRAGAARDNDALAKAKRELAFAYGWYSHCAADLNIHPKVNGVTGDTYRFNTPAEKGIHAAQEAQLAAYLKMVMGGPDKRYDVSIPYEFVSRVLGVSEPSLRQSASVLQGKAAGENAFGGKVTLTREQLERLWGPSVRGSVQQTLDFLADTRRMGNWDLDCGEMSTQEFDQLRRDVIEQNGGTLPKDWGKKYLEWYRKLKGLRGDERMRRIGELVHGTSGSATPPKRTASSGGAGDGWSGGVFMTGMGAEDVPTMLKKCRRLRLRLNRCIEFEGLGGRPTNYWPYLGLPMDGGVNSMGSALVKWSGRSFQQTAANSDGTFDHRLEVRGRMSPDGAQIETLEIRYSRTMPQRMRTDVEIELAGIPINRRIVGTLYEGDVQYACWSDASPTNRVRRFSASDTDLGNGGQMSKLRTIRWSEGDDRKPAIYVVFSL